MMSVKIILLLGVLIVYSQVALVSGALSIVDADAVRNFTLKTTPEDAVDATDASPQASFIDVFVSDADSTRNRNLSEAPADAVDATDASPQASFIDVFVSDADSISNLTLSVAPEDAVDATDASPQASFIDVFVSDVDSTSNLNLSAVPEDAVDSTDASPQASFIDVFVSDADSTSNLTLSVAPEDAVDSTDASPQASFIDVFVSDADSSCNLTLSEAPADAVDATDAIPQETFMGVYISDADSTRAFTSSTPPPDALDSTVNTPPVALFSYSPENPVVNQTIIFNASNSTDPDGTIVNYEWYFGDGNITNTTEEIITHLYSSAGIYTVNLTVTDNDGATNTRMARITVSRMPDLVITDMGVCPENCTIWYNVTNRGNGTAPKGHNTSLFVDGVEKAYDHVDGALEPHASYIGCFKDYNWTYTPPDETITVCADRNNTVIERNESNNCLTTIWMCGDANCDEAVDMSDVIDLLYYVSYPGHYTICSEWSADVNCDKRIDKSDVRVLLHYIGYPGQYELNCCK